MPPQTRHREHGKRAVSSLSRFSVSLDAGLLARFDGQIRELQYPTRSKAIADLIRESLVRQEWKRGGRVAGVIILVYDHHKRDLSQRLTHIQHEHHRTIISTQHIHLDHDHCMEIVVARGQAPEVEALARKLKTAKGVKFAALTGASAGQEL